MLLTDNERAFLDAYVFEATSGPPFGGPATRALSEIGIWYSDLSWLLTAYQHQLSAEGQPSTGIANPQPPPLPWKNAEEVKQRTKTVKAELEPKIHARAKALFDLAKMEQIAVDEHDKGRPLAEILKDLKAKHEVAD